MRMTHAGPCRSVSTPHQNRSFPGNNETQTTEPPAAWRPRAADGVDFGVKVPEPGRLVEDLSRRPSLNQPPGTGENSRRNEGQYWLATLDGALVTAVAMP